jgi:hypothetical protein
MLRWILEVLWKSAGGYGGLHGYEMGLDNSTSEEVSNDR